MATSCGWGLRGRWIWRGKRVEVEAERGGCVVGGLVHICIRLLFGGVWV